MAVVPHEEYRDALYQLEEVEQLATIEKLADMLGLKTKQYRFGAVVPITAASISLVVLSTRWLSPPNLR